MELTSLSEDLRAHPSVEKFAKEGKIDDSTFVKSYLELESKMGSRIEIPKSDATPEQWKEYYKRLAPEQYDVKFDDLQSIKAQEVINDGLKAKFKELGLTNAQAQGMLDAFRGLVGGKEEAIIQAENQKKAENEAAWSQAYPGDLSANVKTEVDNYLKAKFGEDLANEIKNSGVYKDPSKFKTLLDQARKNTDTGIEGKGNSNKPSIKEDLATERSQFLSGAHPVFKDALVNHLNPQHEKAKEAFGKLQHNLATYES